MRLLPRSRSVLPVLVPLLLVLAACNSSPLAVPPAAASPTTRVATPDGTPVIALTDTPASNPTVIAPTKNSATSNPPQAACPPTRNVEIEPEGILELGPGPGIPPTTAAGERLVIVGTVYTEDCAPLVGAMLNVWQTDANGEYGPGHGSNDMLCCYLMGSLRTDARGHYQLVTVKPAHYKGEQLPPPAHIHIEIIHPQTGPSQTEIVFAGDPNLPQTLQGYVLVTLETVPGPEGAPAYLRGVADIIMERSGS